MLYNYYQRGFTDPGQLTNAYMRSGKLSRNDDGTCNSYMTWPNVGDQAFEAPLGVTYQGRAAATDTSTVDAELRQGYPVLAQVHGPYTPMHMVVIVGKQADGDYIINDPLVSVANLRTTTMRNKSYTADAYRFFHGPLPGAPPSPPILNISWGDATWTGLGSNPLNRSVLVELRRPWSSEDLFQQTIHTDNNGVYNGLTLTGLAPGTYDVLIKPQMFLRKSQRVLLSSGSQDLYFPMSYTGPSADDSRYVTNQPLIGDTYEHNIINVFDFSTMVTCWLSKITSTSCTNLASATGHYPDLNRDGVVNSFDYSIYVNSMNNLPPNARIGDGGIIDRSVRIAAAGESIGKASVSSTPVGTGSLSISPSSGSYRLGDVFSVALQFDSAGQSIDGLTAVINFHPSLLQVRGVSYGSLFSRYDDNTSDTAAGTLRLAGLTTINEPVTGSGNFATITLEAVGAGAATLDIDYVTDSAARSGMPQNDTSAQVLGHVSNASYSVGILRVPKDYSTINAALTAARSGEKVLVSPGTYREIISVPQDVTLQGEDRDTTIIDAPPVMDVPSVVSFPFDQVVLRGGATLTGLTIQNSTTYTSLAVSGDFNSTSRPTIISNNRIIAHLSTII